MIRLFDMIGSAAALLVFTGLLFSLGAGCRREKTAEPDPRRATAVQKKTAEPDPRRATAVQKRTTKKAEKTGTDTQQSPPRKVAAIEGCEKRRREVQAQRRRPPGSPVVVKNTAPTIGGSFWRPILVTPTICIARITVEGYRISGNLLHPVLVRVARRTRPAIQKCVASLSGTALLEGIATVTLKTDASGKVTSWKVKGDARVQDTARCLARSLAASGFIPPDADDKGGLELAVVVLKP
jgi:hypothetical protein